MAQQTTNNLNTSEKLLNVPDPPSITRDALRSLGAQEPQTNNIAKSARINNTYNYHPIGWGGGGGGFANNYGFYNSAGFAGLSNLGGLNNPCYTGSASQCVSQFSQNAQGTVASALGYWSQQDQAVVDYSLSLLNAGMPGGQGWNQFVGQYPSPGGQSPHSYGANQSYADATYSQVYSPQIQAVLGYDPNSSYNFTTQFVNYTSSLFSPTADWNTSFSLFPSTTGSYIGGRTSMEGLAGEYTAIAHQQLVNLYTDRSLSELRAEGYLVQTGLLLQDPYYVYYNYIKNSYLTDIYAKSPNYNILESLAAEIGSWTSPPQDETILAERYFKRYLLNYYQALVQYDVLVYLYNNPQDQQVLSYFTEMTNHYVTAIYGLPVVVDWYSGWVQRYQDAHVSFSNVDGMMNNLLANHPGFQEYMDLLQEIRKVTTMVEDRPSVQNATNQVLSVQNQQDFSNAVSQKYNAYQNQVADLLSQTSFVFEMERYYEMLNGLILQDPAYQSLQQKYQNIIQDMQAYESEMMLAVYNCNEFYGTNCNAYYDPYVSELIQSGRSAIIANNLAAFYEEYSVYWYDLYRSERYHRLEEYAQLSVETAISHIIPQITAAREAYKNGTEALPQMSIIKNEMLTVANDLNSVQLPDRNMTVGAALEEMARLASELEKGSVTGTDPESSQDFTISGSFPNPFKTRTRLELDLRYPAEVKVEVYDLSGRLVMGSPVKSMDRGKQSFELNASALSAGMYVSKIHIQTAKGKLVKDHRIVLME